MALTLAHLEKESFIIHYKNKGRIRARFNYTFILCFLLSYCNLWSMHYMSLLYYVPIHLGAVKIYAQNCLQAPAE